MAHAGDDFCFREQLGNCRQARAPSAAGVEDHLGGAVCVVKIKQPVEDELALGIVDEHGKLITLAHLAQHRAEHTGQRTGHAGMEAGVLPQQRSKQGRTCAGQTRDEVNGAAHTTSTMIK